MRSVKDLIQAKLMSVDGEVGTVEDLIFDRRSWVIRYLRVDTGNWLNRRKLLFSPFAVQLPSAGEDDREVFVNMKKEFVESSPPFDPERPISREQEIELNQYYDWPFYWVRVDHSSYPLVELYTEMRDEQGTEKGEEDPPLESLEKVREYSLEARDGRIGQVDDFLIDEDSWHIQYIVVDIGGIVTGKRTIIAPQWIEEFDSDSSKARVDLSVATIQNSPAYDPERFVDDDYEEQLRHYYQRDRDDASGI
jgi:sporulation protein YlmC with PRC-barrel domain